MEEERAGIIQKGETVTTTSLQSRRFAPIAYFLSSLGYVQVPTEPPYLWRYLPGVSSWTVVVIGRNQTENQKNQNNNCHEILASPTHHYIAAASCVSTQYCKTDNAASSSSSIISATSTSSSRQRISHSIHTSSGHIHTKNPSITTSSAHHHSIRTQKENRQWRIRIIK